MTREARQVRCPEAVLGWIPWYADGSLSDRQKGAVEAHAAECAECRAELDMIAGAPFEVDFELPDPQRVFDQITQRIRTLEGDATGGAVIPIERARTLAAEDLEKLERWVLDPDSEEALLEARQRDVLETGPSDTPVAEPAGRSNVVPGPWSSGTLWAAAAALILFLAGGLSGALLHPLGVSGAAHQNGGEGVVGAVYELASAPQPGLSAGTGTGTGTGTGAATGPLLEVVFVDSVSAREISQTLRTLGVEIVSGPSGLGVYRLALSEAAAGGRAPNAADAAAMAARLTEAEEPIALYAEPVP